MAPRHLYHLLSDAELKREVDELVDAYTSAPAQDRAMLRDDVAALRDELRERLRRRGDDGWGGTGVREPLRPIPGGGAGAAPAERDP